MRCGPAELWLGAVCALCIARRSVQDYSAAYDGVAYELVTTPLTFYEAEDACRSRNMVLATWPSGLGDQPPPFISNADLQRQVWFGATNYRSTRDYYFWAWTQDIEYIFGIDIPFFVMPGAAPLCLSLGIIDDVFYFRGMDCFRRHYALCSQATSTAYTVRARIRVCAAARAHPFRATRATGADDPRTATRRAGLRARPIFDHAPGRADLPGLRAVRQRVLHDLGVWSARRVRGRGANRVRPMHGMFPGIRRGMCRGFPVHARPRQRMRGAHGGGVRPLERELLQLVHKHPV